MEQIFFITLSIEFRSVNFALIPIFSISSFLYNDVGGKSRHHDAFGFFRTLRSQNPKNIRNPQLHPSIPLQGITIFYAKDPSLHKFTGMFAPVSFFRP